MYTVVIVDDDELIRKGLEKVIEWEKLEFRVAGTFSNAVEALEYLKDNAVDVILTDIKMPQMSGLELIDHAKTYQEKIKSVVISGYGEFELAKKALLLKTEDYLLKPLGQDDIERVFLKIRENLDYEVEQDQSEKRQKLKKEYELMKLLEKRVEIEQPFSTHSPGQRYYDFIIIKIFNRMGVDSGRNEILQCTEMLQQVLKDSCCAQVKGLFAALILPEHLNGILMQLKREFFQIPSVVYKISIGKEVYSASEVLSSYWSAIELIKENEKSNVIHYDRERSVYKKEWDQIQKLKNQLIEELEHGRFLELEATIDKIGSILERYEVKDSYYFFSNIMIKIIRYFKIENNYYFIYNQNNYSDVNRINSDFKQLLHDFKQDLEAVKAALKENSNHMRKIIVNKAKHIIEQEYADSEMTLASLANQLHVSYGYLSTIFTKETGNSFKTYVVQIRMEKARVLLLSRAYRVYEIAEMVGYSNPRYFTDAFKKYYCCSPAEYISRFRGTEEL